MKKPPRNYTKLIFDRHLKNNRGEVSLIGLIVTIFIFTGFLISVLKMQETNIQIKNRATTYLCFKFILKRTEQYISKMAKLNLAIAGLTGTKFIPLVSVESEALRKAAKISQNILHISYLKNLVKNHYCKLPQTSSLIINLPYQTNKMAVLKRKIDGTVPIQRKEWKIYLPSKDKKFILVGNYQLKNKFSPKPILKTWENRITDLQNFRPSSGFSSLPAWQLRHIKSGKIIKRKI